MTAKKELFLEGLDCANCAAKIEDRVGRLADVKCASMNFTTKTLTIETSADGDMESVLQHAGRIINTLEPDVLVTEKQNRPQTAEKEANHGLGLDRFEILRLAAGIVLFAVGLVFSFPWQLELAVFLLSFLLVGGEVLLRAARDILRGQVFDESFLMSVATIGAFAVGQYPEGVAVMLFYKIGELFQEMAVDHSRKSISALMDVRPDYANLKTEEGVSRVSPEQVGIGDLILIRPGEKVPLDGKVLSGNSMLDTSAITGESLPVEVGPDDAILSGTINKSGLLTVEVTRGFGESTVSKILELVQNAGSHKAPTETFITKFARVYTPFVVVAALAIAVLPPLFLSGASFSDWVYRALIFLVVSCPCALVISIPLGFFGGIGAASKHGILLKGGNYLEALKKVDTIVFDKTGTLTKGVFEVSKIFCGEGMDEAVLLEAAAHAEFHSTHPIAVSILKAYGRTSGSAIVPEWIAGHEDISGLGTKVQVGGKEILAGNEKLMNLFGIPFPEQQEAGTVVHIAVDGAYAGHLLISDEIKEDAAHAIRQLKGMGVRRLVMFTGDNKRMAEQVGYALGLDEVRAGLLPHQKVEELEKLENSRTTKGKLLFVGDGINDAPVLMRADVGVAMGGLGSDAAIEAADIVIMTDEPSKLVSAMKIAKMTQRVVWQNIFFAFAVKGIVLLLGAGGLATMWEAVFADIGVALIAIFNAIRVLHVKDV